MSSTYRPICVSHDPAIVIDTEPDWRTRDYAFERVANIGDNDVLTPHVDCDLLIGVYSYPLVELICPPGRSKNGCGGHHEPKALGAVWFKLLAAASLLSDTHPNLKAAMAAFDNGCWTTARMLRLRSVIG